MQNENVETQTFESKVTSIVSSATLDESGNLVLPEGLELDEATAFAVKTEKRRRDTQAAYSRSQQQLKQVTSAQDAAWNLLEQEISVSLTPEQQTELEELKTVNPEQWRIKLNQLENGKKAKVQTLREETTNKSTIEVELESRKELIAEYNKANPGKELTDDVIENDIPPRFTKQLEKGEITFAEFVSKCGDFLGKGKVLDKGTEADTEVDLSLANGKSKLPDDVIAKSSSMDYSKETY